MGWEFQWLIRFKFFRHRCSFWFYSGLQLQFSAFFSIKCSCQHVRCYSFRCICECFTTFQRLSCCCCPSIPILPTSTATRWFWRFCSSRFTWRFCSSRWTSRVWGTHSSCAHRPICTAAQRRSCRRRRGGNGKPQSRWQKLVRREKMSAEKPTEITSCGLRWQSTEAGRLQRLNLSASVCLLSVSCKLLPPLIRAHPICHSSFCNK